MKSSFCVCSRSQTVPSVRIFQQQVIKSSGMGLSSYLLVKLFFPLQLLKYLLILKEESHKTLGPKFLSTLNKKQGPRSPSAQASLPQHAFPGAMVIAAWRAEQKFCLWRHSRGPTSSHTNVAYVCLTFVSWPDHLNPNGFGKHGTIKLCPFP